MKNTKLEDYIYVLKKALSYKICDDILYEFKNSNEWEDAVVGKNFELNKNERNCQIINISAQHIIQKNENTRKILDGAIFYATSISIKEYNKKFPRCVVQEDSGYKLLKYSEGCFYKQHVDSFKQNPRALSCSFILNNDFEGGEFAFFDRELKYKLEKGDAIMFPSNFMYPHEVMPVTKGTRYSIVTWFI